MTARGRVITVGAPSHDDAEGRLVARALAAEGLPLAARQVVDEDEAALASALDAAVAAPGLTVVLDALGGSGGEVARRVLARLGGARLVLSDRLLALIEEDHRRRGRAMPRRLDRLALLPQGAELWPASAGTPGWVIEIRGAVVAVLPQGSPALCELVDDRVRPLARRRLGGEVALARTLLTAGLSATDAEERLAPWLGREGAVTVSTALADGEVVVRLAARHASRQAAEDALEASEHAVRAALGADCYGRDDDTLESVVGGLLAAQGLSVSLAEGVTGGSIAARLTAVPGASRCVDRAVVAHSIRAVRALGVPDALVTAHGVVSGPVAEAMAAAARRIAGSPVGLAVTGVAGPGGGSAAKPAGTVFVACAAPAGAVRRLAFTGGRDLVRRQAAQAALDVLRRALARPAGG